MKESGIPWIGLIPEEWKVTRIKNLYKERSELSETGEEQLLSVSEYYGVAPTSSKIEDGEFLTRSESLIGYKKCFKNDFVSNIMLAWKGSFGTTQFDGIVSPAYCVYKPSDSISPEYYHYLFRTDLYKTVFKTYSKGIIDSRLRLYSQYFYDIKAIVPPLAEQERIAAVLDAKCGEIDELIGVQEEMIAELTAYRQAVITEAVTRGLDPNAPLRQTNIPWLPQIPTHWEIKSLRYEFDILDYLREPVSAEKRSQENPIYDYYGASGIIDKIDYFNVDDKVLLIGEDGANLVLRHLPLIYKAQGKFWVNNHAHILKPITGDYDFMAYLLEAVDYTDYITGSAQPKLSQSNLKAVKLDVPPLSEQEAIAEYLDGKTAEIDELIALKRHKIAELKEYRKSLIFEYVTGKKLA